MQLAPPQDIKLRRIFLLSIKIKQLGVWGGNGVVRALHKPLPENFRIFRLEMAYFEFNAGFQFRKISAVGRQSTCQVDFKCSLVLTGVC